MLQEGQKQTQQDLQVVVDINKLEFLKWDKLKLVMSPAGKAEETKINKPLIKQLRTNANPLIEMMA